MLYYIKEIIKCLDKSEPKSSGTKSSADPLNLFVVDQDCEKLSKEKSETFQNIVAKMFFNTKLSRTDTVTAIYYLTTRVRDPDQSGCLKMVHLFKYVRETKYLPLILSAENIGTFKCYIGGLYAVHPNIMGHTGVGLIIGRGFPILTYIKQKIDTSSSTKY